MLHWCQARWGNFTNESESESEDQAVCRCGGKRENLKVSQTLSVEGSTESVWEKCLFSTLGEKELLHFKVAASWREREQAETSHWLITSRSQFNSWMPDELRLKRSETHLLVPPSSQGQWESLAVLILCWIQLKTFTVFVPKQWTGVICCHSQSGGTAATSGRPKRHSLWTNPGRKAKRLQLRQE